MKPSSILTLLLVLHSACTIDDDPDYFIDNMRPDLYFALAVPDGAISATVGFMTKKPTAGMPLNVRLLAWHEVGSNLYDSTLEETLLDSPTEKKKVLQWGGTVSFPYTGPGDTPYAKKIGLELRTFLQVGAFNGRPLDGEYCHADIMGPGITDCGPWAEVFVNLWAVCRGALGNLIDCFDTGYILLPAIWVQGIFLPIRMSTAQPSPAPPAVEPGGFFTSELYVYRDATGWRYKQLTMGDFYTRETTLEAILATRPAFGPFATPELAVRDAVSNLGLSPGWQYAGFARQFATGTELHRAAQVLEELLAVTDDEQAPPQAR